MPTSHVLRRVARRRCPVRADRARCPSSEMVHGSRLAPKGFTHVHHLWGDRALLSLSALCGHGVSESRTRCFDMRCCSGSSRRSGACRGRTATARTATRRSASSRAASTTSRRCTPEPTLGTTLRALAAAASGSARQDVGRIAGRPATSRSHGSSTPFALPDASVDYVFVDPPFGANIPYSDLALLVESWHGVLTNTAEEAVMDRRSAVRPDLAEYSELMERVLRGVPPGAEARPLDDGRVLELVERGVAHHPARAGDGRVRGRRHAGLRQGAAVLPSGHRDQRGQAGPGHLGVQAGRRAGRAHRAWRPGHRRRRGRSCGSTCATCR